MSPQCTSMARLQRLALDAEGLLCFAGTPVGKAAPSGLQEILLLRKQSTVKATVGLTPIKSAGAFTAPKIDVHKTFQRDGHKVKHFAALLRTSSADATHDSYYPGPGLHQKPRQKGQTGNEFWEISDELSELVRQGEQEHLDDARRAYELTYLCIEKQINRLAGQAFGPADTPDAAFNLALAALGKLIPSQLGTDPSNWPKVLDKLLGMTKKRDENLWHSIETGEIRQDGKKVIEVLKPSTFFQVGRVPSSQVVHL